jgi:hypothetical protein
MQGGVSEHLVMIHLVVSDDLVPTHLVVSEDLVTTHLVIDLVMTQESSVKTR